MIRRILGILILAAAAASSAAVTETTESYTKEVLENHFLKLEFLPDSLGRLDQICVKSSGRKLLLTRSLTKVSVDPLYEFYRNNTFGCGENFWKNYVAKRDGKSAVQRPEPQKISFKNNWYGGLAVDVRRTVHLAADESIFTFEAEFFNRDEKKSFYLAPWYSLFPADACSSTLVIPAAGGKKVHTLGNVKIFKTDCLAKNPSGLFAAVRNWAATVYSGEKVVLAMIIPKAEFFPDGAFYSWHGKDRGIAYRTMEGIFNGTTLAPRGKRVTRCYFAVFMGIKGIRDIAGTTAVDVAVGEKNLILTLAPARKVAAGTGIVKISCGNGEKIVKIDLPELSPGRSYDFALAFDGGRITHISGTLPDGSAFDLPDTK
jgi:hypothetical protein